MADQWYVREGRLIEGPWPWEHVRQAALSGEIGPETLISRMPTSGWVAARHYAMLKFSDKPQDDARRRVLWKRRGRKSWLAAVATVLILSGIVAITTRTRPQKANPPPDVARQIPERAAQVPPPREARRQQSHLRWQRRSQEGASGILVQPSGLVSLARMNSSRFVIGTRAPAVQAASSCFSLADVPSPGLRPPSPKGRGFFPPSPCGRGSG